MHASSESNPEGAILQLYFKYSRVCFKSGPRSFGTQPADILELFVVDDCMDVVLRDTQLGDNVILRYSSVCHDHVINRYTM